MLKVTSFFPSFIERYYSESFYPLISSILRFVTGWITFSLGDLLYGFAVIWMMIRIYKTSKAALQRTVSKELFFRSVRRTIRAVLIVYIIFNLFWGLNYNRLGIAYQLDLQTGSYSAQDLKNLTADLVQKVNQSRRSMGKNVKYGNNMAVFDQARDAYNTIGRQFGFLKYRDPSVKSSFYGFFGNYLGFLGYYNPFTGESQVNVNVPRFLIPFTTCHEMAHQLGYADEDEANFVGYLAAKSSNLNTFQYSVYFNLFAYANRQLSFFDSGGAKNNYQLLDTLVKADIQDYKKFVLAHENVIEPFITLLYGDYLKANNQPNGIETYDEVVSWLIAYKKKYNQL